MAQEIQLQFPFDIREDDRLGFPEEVRDKVIRCLGILLLELLEIEALGEGEEGGHDLQ